MRIPRLEKARGLEKAIKNGAKKEMEIEIQITFEKTGTYSNYLKIMIDCSVENLKEKLLKFLSAVETMQKAIFEINNP